VRERLYTDLVRGVLLLLLALLTVGAGAQPETQETARPSFTEWLDEVRAEALARGIRTEILEQAFAGVEEPLPVVLERDRTQTEIVLPLETYIGRRLTRSTIRTGRQMLARHQALLRKIEVQYGVPGRVITAIWGIESNFGRFSGVRPTISALATLAWDPRRSTLFRRELFSALEILNRGDVEPGRLQGSWAGAMGQPQFMPSSYLEFAEDFDQDGRRDIWASAPDVFASIANYLKGHGWTAAERWGREVTLTREAGRRAAADVARRDDGCRARRDMSVALPLEEWQQIGVRLPGGASLPDADRTASLVSGTTRHFLVYGNYEALLEYNCAHAYALTVALLADAFGTGG
jgi:peptidoglycan lytic transglycosylase B